MIDTNEAGLCTRLLLPRLTRTGISSTWGRCNPPVSGGNNGGTSIAASLNLRKFDVARGVRVTNPGARRRRRHDAHAGGWSQPAATGHHFF